MEYSVQPLSWIQEVYDKDPEQNPGYTGLVDDVKEEPQLQGGLKRMYQLKQSSGVKTQGIGARNSAGSDERIVNSAVVKEYYERPSRSILTVVWWSLLMVFAFTLGIVLTLVPSLETGILTVSAVGKLSQDDSGENLL
jgi:hypothetical protein